MASFDTTVRQMIEVF